jgi:cytochrome c553
MHRGKYKAPQRKAATVCSRRAEGTSGVWAAAMAGLLAAVQAAVLAGLPAASLAATPGAAAVVVPDTLAQRLQPCTACHGPEGRASREGYLPRIAGKPAGYLYQQLLNFREGRRSNSAMAGLLAQQRDPYLREMAGYFASLDLPHAAVPATPVASALLARGALLAREGDPARRLPACSACHGSALGGTLPAVPGLLGLPRDYLIAQLGAWQTGQRNATAPDCMADIARRLGPGDASAVAGWLAAQPVPAGWAAALPASGPATPKVPLACGSVDHPPP